MCQNVCESYLEQQCQYYLYKNCTSYFYECRTSPVIRAFKQYVELSFCLWNIPDCEALRASCDICNPYVLHEYQVSFLNFPVWVFSIKMFLPILYVALGIPVYERRSFNLNCLRRVMIILAVLSFLLRP